MFKLKQKEVYPALRAWDSDTIDGLLNQGEDGLLLYVLRHSQHSNLEDHEIYLTSTHWNYLIKNSNLALLNSSGKNALRVLGEIHLKITLKEDTWNYLIEKSDVNLMVNNKNFLNVYLGAKVNMGREAEKKLINKTHFDFTERINILNWLTMAIKKDKQKNDSSFFLLKNIINKVDSNIMISNFNDICPVILFFTELNKNEYDNVFFCIFKKMNGFDITEKILNDKITPPDSRNNIIASFERYKISSTIEAVLKDQIIINKDKFKL